MKQALPWVFVGLLVAGLAWALFVRSPEVVTKTVEVEKIKYIDRQIRANETKASNLIVEGRSLTNARKALERELGRMVLGRYFIDYTNNRNSQDRIFTERIDLLNQDKGLLRERCSIFSNRSETAEKNGRTKTWIIAGLAAVDVAILVGAASSLFRK